MALTQPPDQPLAVGMAVDVNLVEEAIPLAGLVTAVDPAGEFWRVRAQFAPLPLASHRSLVTLLFCRPGQWRRWNSPGELRSLGLLLRLILWPRPLHPQPQPRVVTVAKG